MWRSAIRMVSEELMKNFRTILKLEEEAEQTYAEHIEEFSDMEIKQKLEKIRKDEEEHVRLAKKIVMIAEDAAER